MAATTTPRRLTRTGKVVRGLAGVAVLILADEALGRAGIVHRDFFPPASDVLRRTVTVLGDESFRTDLLATLKAFAFGLAIAVAVAIPLGVLLGSVPLLERAVRPVLELLRPIPSVALIPLVGLILGAGLRPEVTLIVYASVWPVLFNTLYGLADADPVTKDSLRVFGFGPLGVLWRVSLPSAAPFIATGVRLAASTALILAVSTEYLAGYGDGIGNFMSQARSAPGGTTDLLACLVWAGLLGLAVNWVLVAGERRLLPWSRV